MNTPFGQTVRSLHPDVTVYLSGVYLFTTFKRTVRWSVGRTTVFSNVV